MDSPTLNVRFRTVYRPSGLLAAALIAACSQTTVLRVDHRGGVTRVQLRRIEQTLVRSEEPVEVADCAFYDLERGEGGSDPSGGEIWRVMAPSPAEGALEVRYGVVPSGFVQVSPPASDPPVLEPDRRYRVACSGLESGETEFRIPKADTRAEPPRREVD